MLRRRGFLGGLAGLFVAPAVITTPGLLMPVSVKAFPSYGPNGLLTLEMIAERFNRSIRHYGEVRAEWNAGQKQSNVDLAWDRRNLTLSMDEFAERFVDPAAASIVNRIVAGGGRLALGAPIEVPSGHQGSIEGAVNGRGGVHVRALTGYDIGTDMMKLRLDVKHS